MNFGDPELLARIVVELRDRHGMSDEQFRALHHRRNIKDGIAAHLRYLEQHHEMKTEHQQLARRLHACLHQLREGAKWSDAIRVAEREVPGSRSQ
jgi:hypothetical protein